METQSLITSQRIHPRSTDLTRKQQLWVVVPAACSAGHRTRALVHYISPCTGLQLKVPQQGKVRDFWYQGTWQVWLLEAASSDRYCAEPMLAQEEVYTMTRVPTYGTNLLDWLSSRTAQMHTTNSGQLKSCKDRVSLSDMKP